MVLLLLLQVSCRGILASDALAFAIKLRRIVVVNVLALRCLGLAALVAIVHIVAAIAAFHEAAKLIVAASATVGRLLLKPRLASVATMATTVSTAASIVEVVAATAATSIVVTTVVAAASISTPAAIASATVIVARRLSAQRLVVISASRVAVEGVLLRVLLLLCILRLLQLIDQVVSRLLLEVAVVVAL